MSNNHVFVVSEWLPKDGCEHELLLKFKKLMALTLEKEKGCLRANATTQISHPNASGNSKYKIILLQEYVNLNAFEIHCNADYVANAFKELVENPKSAIVAEWQVRLFEDIKI